MREVNVRMLHFATDLARAGGVDERQLLDGIAGLRSVDLGKPGRIDWDDFVEILERLEVALGGADGLANAARLAVPIAYPELRAVAAIFLSPIALFTFATMRLVRASFTNVEVEELERTSTGRVRWRQTIAPASRGSTAFLRVSGVVAGLIPRHLDLPEAKVEILRLTPHSAEYRARFLQPPPLKARGRQAVSAATALIASQIDDLFARFSESFSLERTTSGAPSTDGAAAWSKTLGLSPRQREVFTLLIEGRANKEIAHVLGCSERNVEFHVGRILRAARVTSRAELLVKVLALPPPR